MKPFRPLLIFVLGIMPTALRAVPDRNIEKAEAILLKAEVVTTRAVGFAGACPEANWALSVIVQNEPVPVERLLAIADAATREGRLLCIAGVKAADPEAFTQHIDVWKRDAKWNLSKIEIQNGCVVELVTVREALDRIKAWPRDTVLYAQTPPFSQTVCPTKRTAKAPESTVLARR